MFGLGAGELFLVLVIALIFIGPKKLPELAKGLGKGLKEFNKAKNELVNSINEPDATDSNDMNNPVKPAVAAESSNGSNESIEETRQALSGVDLSSGPYDQPSDEVAEEIVNDAEVNEKTEQSTKKSNEDIA